jgi:hypothetical protein
MGFVATTIIFVRCICLFTMKFFCGEHNLLFYTQLRAQTAECDLENLGNNKLLGLIMISKCLDPVLKVKYLKTDQHSQDVPGVQDLEVLCQH